MRIAINARFLLPDKLEGFGVFTHEVVSRLAIRNPEIEFILFFDRPFNKRFIYADNVKGVVVSPPARHPFLFIWWFEWSVARQLKRHKADLFFSPDGYLSLRSKIPQVPVIHDLAFEHFPRDVPALSSWHYRRYFPKYAEKAVKILTVSDFSKRDIIDRYGTESDKISVVYNGVKEGLTPLDDASQQKVRDQYANGQPYFLYVGAMHQRKNIGKLLQAFEAYVEEGGEALLLLVGRKAWGNREMEEIYKKMTHADKVVFSGRLDDEQLKRVLASSLCLTYLSYFEGFGLPLLESMACGKPVICANKSSLPEVTGEAGLLVNPFNIDAIKKAMLEMEQNHELREELSQKALRRARNFSWKNTAVACEAELMKVLTH